MAFLSYWKRLNALSYPVEDLSKAEFVPIHRTVDELVSDQAFDFDVEAVPPQEYIRSCKSDPLVAVEEAVVVTERLHQCGGLFFDGVVIASLRTKNGGLNSTFVADALEAAESFDQQKVHLVHFCHGQIFPHLLGEAL